MKKIEDLQRKNQSDSSAEKIIDLKKFAAQKKERAEIKAAVGAQYAKKPIDEKTVFWWTTTEEIKTKKGILWYAVISLITLAVLIFSIIQQNWLFLIFIVLAVVVYYLLSTKEPVKHLFRLKAKRLTIDEKTYDFEEMKSFSFYQKMEQDYLVFETNLLSQKHLMIPLKKDKEKIAAFLKNVLPEKPYEESFLDTLKDFLKF